VNKGAKNHHMLFGSSHNPIVAIPNCGSLKTINITPRERLTDGQCYVFLSRQSLKRQYQKESKYHE
jgi:hypothetical protein